jgi:large subunit ribosomal protein L10
MKLNKEQKKERSKKLSKEFEDAESVFFTSYQGLKFNDIAGLRQKLLPLNCKFGVIKNSVALHALKSANVGKLPNECFLKGPVAMALLEKEDFVSVAKILAEFGKDFPALKMKACYCDERWFDAKGCISLSNLHTRNTSLQILVSKLHMCKSTIASILHAPMRDLAFALKALEDRRKSESLRDKGKAAA